MSDAPPVDQRRLHFRRHTAIARALVVLAFGTLCAVHTNRDSNLSVTVFDAGTGALTPVRVRITDDEGRAVPAPEEAIGLMWGFHDEPEGYRTLPDSAFYVDGPFAVAVPPGSYHVRIIKGTEYLALTDVVTVGPGEQVSKTYHLERWIDMPARNWYASDGHIHLRRTPRENVPILRWLAAEDIHVGNILWMGDFWSTYFGQHAWGEAGRYQEGRYLLAQGQEEPRTPELGHTISLGAGQPVRFKSEYYSYGKVFDRVHELGGIVGYAHKGRKLSFTDGNQGLTLHVLQGKVDFLEVLQYWEVENPLSIERYYHFLDLGFKITALAGSDFPYLGPPLPPENQRTPFWLGRPYTRNARIGNVRFYTYIADEFSYDAWLENVKAGHTFVTNGPILELTVNGHMPGDAVDVAPGTPLRIEARARGHTGQVPLRDLEIVVHGQVAQRVTAGGANQSREALVASLEMPAEHGLWIAARCAADSMRVAHTSPVYVTVNGGGFHNPQTAAANLALCAQYLRELEGDLTGPTAVLDEQAWRHKEALEREIAETRRLLSELRNRVK